MSRWRVPAGVLVLLAVLAGFVALAATAGDGSDDETSPRSATAVHRGLCRALQAAEAGEHDEARTAFFDRSHDGLHDLAARAADIDRSLAADLLEAKQRVEASLDGDDEAPDLAGDLRSLAAVTASATARVDGADVKECR